MRKETRAHRAVANNSAISLPPRESDDAGWEFGELEEMVGRCLKGEPLRYILSGQGSVLLSVEPRTIG